MGVETAKFLDISNINFIEGDYANYKFKKKYDIIFSLSNHFTIDGNLNIGFEDYIWKIFDNINNDGILFFESHDINGDDKDMDLETVKKIPISVKGLKRMSRFELPVEPNIIISLSILSLFKANMMAKNIEIGMVIIDNFGINRIE